MKVSCFVYFLDKSFPDHRGLKTTVSSKDIRILLSLRFYFTESGSRVLLSLLWTVLSSH